MKNTVRAALFLSLFGALISFVWSLAVLGGFGMATDGFKGLKGIELWKILGWGTAVAGAPPLLLAGIV